MVTDTNEYKYVKSWYGVFERDRDAGTLGAGDLPADTALQQKFIDSTDAGTRFYPVNYQDFWIATDVNSTYNWIHDTQIGPAYTKFNSPYLAKQPQPYTYTILDDTGHIPYIGWSVTVAVPPNGSLLDYHYYYSYLCCATDTPGILASIPDNGLTCISSDTQNYINRWHEAVWRTISATNGVPNVMTSSFNIWTAISSVDVQSYYNLSGPSFTNELSTSLLSAPSKVIVYLDAENNRLHSVDGTQQLSSALSSSSLFNNYCFGLVCSTDGLLREHYIHRSNSRTQPVEGYGTTETSASGDIQLIRWYNDPDNYNTNYCQRRAYFPPKNAENGSNFRIYVLSPTICYYGDLSADFYFTRLVRFADNVQYPPEKYAWFWTKKTLTFEASPYEIDWNQQLKRKVLMSKESFSFKDLYCLWDPLNENDAKDKINQLRQLAGLSTWSWNGYRECDVYDGIVYVVWKFKHPLMQPTDYHYTNQDAPSN